jgi:hypothetical protein
VADVALPDNEPVIVPAVKLPLASRLTIVLAVLRSVDALASIVAKLTFAALDPPTVETTVAACVPVTSPSRLPLKLVAVPAVVADVAVVAFPSKFAVIDPAVKLPLPSRLTIVFIVLTSVAALAKTVAAFTLAADDPPTVETTVAP